MTTTRSLRQLVTPTIVGLGLATLVGACSSAPKVEMVEKSKYDITASSLTQANRELAELNKKIYNPEEGYEARLKNLEESKSTELHEQQTAYETQLQEQKDEYEGQIRERDTRITELIENPAPNILLNGMRYQMADEKTYTLLKEAERFKGLMLSKQPGYAKVLSTAQLASLYNAANSDKSRNAAGRHTISQAEAQTLRDNLEVQYQRVLEATRDSREEDQ